jgi:hypothetical protein
MADVLALTQLWIWNRFVGAVIGEDDGRMPRIGDGFSVERRPPHSLR